MASEEGNFTVAWMCRHLGVSRSSYYHWKKHHDRVNSYAQRRADLADVVREIFLEQRQRAGARGIAAELRRRGIDASVKLVGRIMRENDLVAIQPHAYKRTTVRDPNADELVLDLVEQDFDPAHYEPGEVLVGDITYLKTHTGWLYLATVIDLATRKVLGWHVDKHMKTSLVTSALAMALGNGAVPGCVFHSDRGTQYTSGEFAQFCEANFVYQSKGRVATCYDNAVAESFFASLKVEFYYHDHHPGGTITKNAIAQWITFYNTTRFHSAIGYRPPQHEWARRIALRHTLVA